MKQNIKKHTQSLDLMDEDEEMRLLKLRYPKIAFRRGDKAKSFYFNVMYSLVWIVLTIGISLAGYLFVNPFCGLGAILSLLMFKGLLDVLRGNTVLVTDGNSLVYRKTKERTKKDYQSQMNLAKKLFALDGNEVEQLESLISDILSDDEENNQEKAFAIASLLNMDKNKDGQVSEAEMMSTAYDDTLASFGLEADQTSIKANEALANQILPYLDSNPNASSKDIVEMFSNKEDKYDQFA